MRKIIDVLDANAGWILVALILLFIIDGVVRLICHGRQTKKETSGVKDAQREFLSVLNQMDREIFVLISRGTMKPIYVGGNVEGSIGVSKESIYADITRISDKMDETSENLWLLYKEWNREKPLVFESGNQSVNKRFRLTIKEDDAKQFDILKIQDISMEVEKIGELTEQLDQAKKNEESKTTFLSNMSHEIRTPLNGMLGMIELAKMNMNDAQLTEEYLEKAKDLSNFLLSVINDILDMSRIESGKTELEQVAFDIQKMGGKLENMFRTNLENRGIRFDVEYREITNPYVVGDELRITQVLTNFLSNAMKFTPAGGSVGLTLRQMDELEGQISWMLRVSDTGKGMTPAFLHRIFKPFEQENSGISKQYGGSGLGMTIADNLVHLMNGQILVDSEVGKGSTFTVFIKLPIAKEEEVKVLTQRKPKEKHIDLKGRRILMAEDNEINAAIATKMLESKGLIIEVAENGQVAVNMFEEHKAGYYDAILMDIQMPELDGWEATRVIRGLSKEDAKLIPIFALSADAFVENKRKSAEVGMNGHITKPIDYNEIETSLQNSFQ